MPLIAFLINTVISFAFSYFVSFFTGYTHYELVTEPTIYRYICIVIINLTDILIFAILVKFRSHNINLRKITDVIAFIILPVVVLLIIYSTFYIMVITKYKSDIMAYLAVICLCMITVTAIVWYAVSRISKDNEVSTRLLLMEQQIRLYESNILQSNVQIEKISRIKHDMKNNLLCIYNLISNSKYEEARKICSEVSDNLNAIYTPIDTKNPLLNAVINVEQEKASVLNIVFTIEIADEMIEFSENSDIVSIIGNMCDNAVEYLKKHDKSNRKMWLKIYSHNNHYIIDCGNKIEKSVLNENPELLTSKADSKNHGKGIEILKSVAKKYNGEVKFFEKDGYFHSIMILMKQNLPEIR